MSAPETTATREGEFRQIPAGELDPNPTQPRRRADDKALVELAASVAQRGVIEPLIVTPRNGRFLIAAGERRYRAARMAGLSHLPCLVRDLSDPEVLEMALIENLQREDLNAVDEAECIRRLLDEGRLTFDELGKRIGKTKSYISLRLALLDLPATIVDDLRAGKISPKHARYLLQLKRPAQSVSLARRIVTKGLSSRQTQAIVERSLVATERGGQGPAAARDRVKMVVRGLPSSCRLVQRDDRVHLTVSAPNIDQLVGTVQRALRALAPHAAARSGSKTHR